MVDGTLSTSNCCTIKVKFSHEVYAYFFTKEDDTDTFPAAYEKGNDMCEIFRAMVAVLFATSHNCPKPVGAAVGGNVGANTTNGDSEGTAVGTAVGPIVGAIDGVIVVGIVGEIVG